MLAAGLHRFAMHRGKRVHGFLKSSGGQAFVNRDLRNRGIPGADPGLAGAAVRHEAHGDWVIAGGVLRADSVGKRPCCAFTLRIGGAASVETQDGGVRMARQGCELPERRNVE